MDTLCEILKGLDPGVPLQTIEVYTRHSKDCPKCDEGKDWKKCNCRKYLYISQRRKKPLRPSANTRSWETAETLKRDIQDWLDPDKSELRRLKEGTQSRQTTVNDAIDLYLADAAKSGLKPETLRKLRRIFGKQFRSWAGVNGLIHLNDCTTPLLTRWRNAWTLGPLATQKTQEQVRSFFGFCIRQEWLTVNPASQLTKIKVPRKLVTYFTDDEFKEIIDATYKLAATLRKGHVAMAARLRTLILLMRWSGLRISDAVTLERCRLHGDNLLLDQRKTDTPVFAPLPPDVAQALRDIPDGAKPSARFFFWGGGEEPEGAIKYWRRQLQRVFKLADIRNQDGTQKRCHPHMFRHTSAVRNLEAGMLLEEVSMLLGHSSVKITEKYYAPWVSGRQKRLESSVRLAWFKQGVLDQGGNEGSPAPATLGVV